MLRFFCVPLCAVPALILVGFVLVGPLVTGAAAAEPVQPKPVEADMHEYMEYAFQPVYLRLKAALAKAPADRAGWKSVKSDSLLLAEQGNLLLDRAPEENAAEWQAISAEVRDLGGDLYRAAKASDYVAARQKYEAMLTSCNKCHTTFAHGEHQLTP